MEKENAIILEKKLKAQSEYTQYVRKARKLADKGFMYEYLAFKSNHMRN